MKKFVVTVNGSSYEVMVEEVNTEGNINSASVQHMPGPFSAPPAPSAAAGSNNTDAKILAPMPGTILKINVKAGDSFKKGETLLVLEAMKMENDISAPVDGTVASVKVSHGASVNTGDVMI